MGVALLQKEARVWNLRTWGVKLIHSFLSAAFITGSPGVSLYCFYYRHLFSKDKNKTLQLTTKEILLCQQDTVKFFFFFFANDFIHDFYNSCYLIQVFTVLLVQEDSSSEHVSGFGFKNNKNVSSLIGWRLWIAPKCEFISQWGVSYDWLETCTGWISASLLFPAWIWFQDREFEKRYVVIKLRLTVY